MLKREIRTVYKEQRKLLTAQQKSERSAQIAMHLLEHFDLQNKCVSIFLPIEQLNEINTWEIINSVEAKYVLPVLSGENLKHVLFEDQSQLKISDWGIPEPQYGDELLPSDIDIVLIPLLACDKKGNRVGYGKGFYDRFLEDCGKDCLFIGLSFFPLIDAVSDTHKGDVSLKHCVTPSQVYSF